MLTLSPTTLVSWKKTKHLGSNSNQRRTWYHGQITAYIKRRIPGTTRRSQFYNGWTYCTYPGAQACQPKTPSESKAISTHFGSQKALLCSRGSQPLLHNWMLRWSQRLCGPLANSWVLNTVLKVLSHHCMRTFNQWMILWSGEIHTDYRMEPHDSRWHTHEMLLSSSKESDLMSYQRITKKWDNVQHSE